ncbi:MAG: DUF2807 domain-containing protein [Pedobacter sp.]|nr:MAG: DUF2807 domain-containing protein [Pedobacter sp.]
MKTINNHTMKAIILFALSSLLLISCSKDRLTASGDNTTETRSVRDFTGVKSSGANDVHITYGTEFKVTLKGSDNLIPYFKTEIIGNTLHLGYERVNVRRDDIEIFVTLPSIEYVSLSGSGSVDIYGAFPAVAFFDLSISGSGEVEIEDGFNANETVVRISGSGEADLERLTTKHAEVHISGSGDAKLNIQDTLKARISGSGKVYYKGSPQIDSQISGSGKLIKL